MQLVYVAGKYSGETREEVQANIDLAETVGKALLKNGCAPLIPHKITSHWDTDPQFQRFEHKDWMRACIVMLNKCDAIIMCPGWQDSKGARQEHEYATICGIPVLVFDNNVIYTEAQYRRKQTI